MAYIQVKHICPNAPAATKTHSPVDHFLDGHTLSQYAYGNPAGARWGAAMRRQTCIKCGAKLVGLEEHRRSPEETRWCDCCRVNVAVDGKLCNDCAVHI